MEHFLFIMNMFYKRCMYMHVNWWIIKHSIYWSRSVTRKSPRRKKTSISFIDLILKYCNLFCSMYLLMYRYQTYNYTIYYSILLRRHDYYNGVLWSMTMTTKIFIITWAREQLTPSASMNLIFLVSRICRRLCSTQIFIYVRNDRGFLMRIYKLNAKDKCACIIYLFSTAVCIHWHESRS